MPANLENSAVARGLEKVVFNPIPKKGNAKERSNYCTIALLSHTSKVMLKFLLARLQQYVNQEILDAQAEFRKGRGTRVKLPTSVGSLKKQQSSEEHLLLLFIDYAKAFDCVDYNKMWKILKEMGYQITFPAS